MLSNVGNNVNVKVPTSALSTYQTKYPGTKFYSAAVERIELNMTELAASVNNEYRLTALTYPEEAIKVIQWISSDESVATVSSTGLVRGIAPGTATITAKALDGSSVLAECAVEITFVNMESIQFAENAYWLRIGHNVTIDYTTSPDNASNKEVNFTSSNSEVATANGFGYIIAHSAGTATITAASAANPEVTATATIDVRAYKPARWIVEDKNGDGNFTIRDVETEGYMYTYCSWDSFSRVSLSGNGEGNYGSEWQIFDTNWNNAHSIQGGANYYLRNREIEQNGYSDRTLTLDGTSVAHSFNEGKRSSVEFLPLADGTYYIAIDGYLIQQENSYASLSIYATDGTYGDWGYTLANTNNDPKSLSLIITSYSGSDFALSVPEEITANGITYPVVAIGDNVFQSNTNLTSVTLPNTVKRIGNSAFSGCSNLIGITPSEALTTIGNNAFQNCSMLSSFEMPESVTEIGDQAFYECSNLIGIRIPDGVKRIGDFAFYNCQNLQKVEILDSSCLKEIGYSAFRGCYSLHEFNFTAGLTSIGGYAFTWHDFWSTENYKIHYSYNNNQAIPFSTIDLTKCVNLQAIGDYAFMGSNATKIDLSGCTALTTIGNGVFMSNPYVTEIDLSGCSALTTIGNSVFVNTGRNNNIAVSLTNCASLNSISDESFALSGVSSIDLSGCIALVTIGSKAFAYTNLKSISIPDAVTEIGTYAFANDTRLKSIEFGASSALRSFGNYAFQNCSALENITLPKNLGAINSYVFDNCSGLKNVIASADGNLKSIGMNAFNNCSSMETLAVPATVTSIASAAFNFGSASTVLVFASADPKGYDPYMFNNLGEYNNVRVKIPASALSTYQAKYPDMTFITTDVERIELNMTEFAASVNNEYQLTATTYPEEAINAIQWISSDESVATVSGTGLVRGIAPGTATITAMALDGSGVMAECAVEVTFVSMESIQFAENSYWLRIGNNATIGITTTPDNASDREVTFTSSDPDVASVDKYGNVSALAVGTATITAVSASNPEATATATIDVRAYKPARWIVEDKNGDGWFTIRDVETELYISVNGNWSDYNWNSLDYNGEGHSYSEWSIFDSNYNRVNSIISGNSYYIRNRWINNDCGYEGYMGIFDSSFITGFYNDYRKLVTFLAQPDGNYYMAVDDYLVQQEPSSGCSLGFYAANGTSGDWGYSLANTSGDPSSLGLIITSYTGSDFALTIPEEITANGTTYPVVGIGSNVFSGNSNLTSVTLPNSLKSIGSYAFQNCSNLISVNIPDGMKTIGNGAFQECSSLATILISRNAQLETIGNSAFYNCKLLSNFAMPTTVTSIGASAFSNCQKLSSIRIPDGVTSIGSSAFYQCSSLKTVEISDNAKLKTIGDYAFYYCNSLEAFNFPAMLEVIGNYAFYRTNISEVNLSGNVALEAIGSHAFYGNRNLTNIDLSGCSALTTLGDEVFRETGYATVSLANCAELTAIPQYAFYNSYLNTIDLSGCTNIQSIGSYAFAYCSNLTQITIPDAVNAFGTYIFQNASRLKKINFGAASELRSIGNYAFQNCSNLQTLTLPKGVGSINSYTFSGCTSLKTLILAADGELKSIGMNAFENCTSMTALAIPSTVMSIASAAFHFGSAKTVLIFASDDPIGYDANMFNNLGENNNVRVKIPASGLASYQAKYPDMTFITTDVERIELNMTELAASVNNEYQLVATISPEEAINAIQWISSDESIATIDADGKLHALAEGDVTITAKALDGSGIEATCEVSVTYVQMEAIQLAQTSYWMRNGNTGKVSITTTPSNASDRTVTYTTSNPAIATVDENGVVTAHSIGKCEITATSVSTPDVTATAEIDVRAYKPARWIIEDENEDGWFTLQDAETEKYMTIGNSIYDEYGDYHGYSGVSPTDYASDWMICKYGTKEPVSEIQENVKYSLRNRNYFKQAVTFNYGVLSVYEWTDEDWGVEFEFHKAADGSYYLSYDGNVIQQETETTDNFTTYYVSGSNADWAYTLQSTAYYPETLAAKMTSYKASASDVVMPEKVKYEGEDYPVYGISTLENRNRITTITLPSSLRWMSSSALSYSDNLRKVFMSEGITNIPMYAFSDCNKLDDVVLPSTVKNIDQYAFRNCYGLTNITLSKDLNGFASNAFEGDRALSFITIPAENTNYMADDGVLFNKNKTEFAFFPKGKVGSYTIPASIACIQDIVFAGCSLSKIIIPNTVQSIGQYAFNAAMISEVNIEGTDPSQLIALAATNAFYGETFFNVDDEVATAYKSAPVWSDIADRIFAKSDYHKEVTLTAMASSPALLAAIGGDKAANQIVSLKISGTMNGYDIMMLRNKMKNLRYLDLGDVDILDNDGGYEYYTGYHTTAHTVPAMSFYNMSNLRTICLPQTAQSIGYRAFYGCNKLEEVLYMAEPCTTIESEAFARSAIQKIVIGPGVTSIGQRAFEDCSSLADVTIGNSVKVIDEYAFRSCSSLRTLKIGNNLQTIRPGAFAYCSGLKQLILPASLRTIEGYDWYSDEYANDYGPFYSCSNLEEIEFNEGLTHIGNSAFAYCSALKELKLPESVNTIKANAFRGCSSLDEVHVSSMIRGIDDYAFVGCNLKSVYAYALAPVSINQNTFAYNGVTLFAPDNTYYIYYLNTQWSQFEHIEEFEPTYSKWYTARNTDVEIDVENYPIRSKEDGATGSLEPGSGLIFVGNGTQLVDNMVLNWSHGDNYPAVIPNGNLNVETLKFLMNVNPGTWYFFCFPFDIDLSTIEMDSKWVWRYYDSQERADNGSGGWKNVTDNVLHANQGYIFQSRDAGTLNIPVNNPVFGDPDKSLELKTYSSQTSQIQDASWNFMGNPTLSYYNIGHLADSQFDAPITVWDASNNTYEAIMPGDDDYAFHPFEAYFVQKPEGMDEMDFLGENRETYTESQETLMKARRARASMPVDVNRLIVNLTITNDSLTDKTRVVFNDQKSMAYELGSDASKFMSSEAPQIYTFDHEVKYAINERPKSDMTVKLGYSVPTSGIYYIAAPRMDQAMALKDLATGRTHSFTEDGDYEFQSEAGQFDERFLLIADPMATGLSDAKFGAFALEAVEGGINVRGLNGETALIYNIGGQLMASAEENGFVEVPAGTYVVKMSEKSRKVVVK